MVSFNHVMPFFFLSITAADSVVRNVYYKYFHPKEALVSNGVLNRFVITTNTVLDTICPPTKMLFFFTVSLHKYQFVVYIFM